MKRSSSSSTSTAAVANRLPPRPISREEEFRAITEAVYSINSPIRQEVATVVFVEGFENYPSFSDRAARIQMFNDLFNEFTEFLAVSPGTLRSSESVLWSNDPFPLHTLTTRTLRNLMKKFNAVCYKIRQEKEFRVKQRVIAVMALKRVAELLDIPLTLNIVKNIVINCV